MELQTKLIKTRHRPYAWTALACCADLAGAGVARLTGRASANAPGPAAWGECPSVTPGDVYSDGFMIQDQRDRLVRDSAAPARPGN